MSFSAQFPAQFFRRIVARFRAWKERRRSPQIPSATLFHIPTYVAGIHREVTPNGVRVYSLCGDCGAQLNASATLCEECAQKRSRPARPY
jgi:ribosomal protein L40E